MCCKLTILVILCISLSASLYSQEPQSEKDSLRYMAIEAYSKKSKFARYIHKLTFRPINKKETGAGRFKTNDYTRVKGAIVRKIHIVTLDPFGYDVHQASKQPKGFFKQTGNSLHIQTKSKVIENLLLFKEDVPFDPLLVEESERLIRLQAFVREVVFQALPTSRKRDSVDVFITVGDVWSTVPAFTYSNTALTAGFTEYNFLGQGHALHADYLKNRLRGNRKTRFSYLIPNIGQSYISSKLEYVFTDSLDLVSSIQFERRFFSPITKWSGGVFLGKLVTYQTYLQRDTVHLFDAPTNLLDVWGARSWQLFKGNTSDARTTNLIVSGRFRLTRYPGDIPEEVPRRISGRENFYFAGVGVTSRNYVQDNYIFKFGLVEDVPVGRYLGFTLGRQVMQENRWYMGIKAAWGSYYPFGYLSNYVEYGTFKDGTGYNQQVVTGHINYFTPLLNLGNWKVRQFVKPTFVFGINRLPTDNLTFRDGFQEFEGVLSSATHMLGLTLQTQTYPPWNLLGFRFGPYLFSTFGILADRATGFSGKQFYSLFGLGLLIKNDYLLFDAFQISLVYFPVLPANGYHVFQSNAYKTGDFGFRDFELGKPGMVEYR